MHQAYLVFKFVSIIALVSKQDLGKQFWRFLVIRPNLEVRPYLPSTKFLCRMFAGGDTCPGENIVGPTVPSDTVVPMIFHKSIKTTTTSIEVLNSSPK
jgi:hypothetical protein